MQQAVSKVRLKDIAMELGLSTATVSLCLNPNRGRYQVNADTVQRVRDFAAKVGYVPDRNARNLKRGCRRCVGLLTNHHWRAGQKCLPAVFRAEQMLTAHGIECRQLSSRNQLEGLAQLRDLGCSEVIVFDPVVEDGRWGSQSWQPEELAKRFAGLKIYAVDFSIAGETATDQIVRLGVPVWDFQEKLIEIMQKYYPGESMIQSWRCSQKVIGSIRRSTPELIFSFKSEDPFKIGAEGAQQYLEQRKKHRITNVFWGDDRMACGFINELLRHRVSIPDEVNIISFDNLDFSQYLAIPLTTWGIPIVHHTQMVLESIISGTDLTDVISQPVLSVGASAKLTSEIIDELTPYCEISNEGSIL